MTELDKDDYLAEFQNFLVTVCEPSRTRHCQIYNILSVRDQWSIDTGDRVIEGRRRFNVQPQDAVDIATRLGWANGTFRCSLNWKPPFEPVSLLASMSCKARARKHRKGQVRR